MPLSACLGSYFSPQAEAPHPAEPHPAATPTPSDAILDQLPTVDATARGAALVDLLRPAYQTLGRRAPNT